MIHKKTVLILLIIAGCALFFICNDHTPPMDSVHNPLANPENGPAAGNPEGTEPIPADAAPEGITSPDIIIGTGTPGSCTPEKVLAAIAHGGVITFNGGTLPFTITLPRQAEIYNDSSTKTVIDGGGVVTLSGGGHNRILYMNTCDERLHWTTSHCQDQEYPHLTVQNITFTDGNSAKDTDYDGGGAIWIRGGRFKAVNCRFFNNICSSEGPDAGGAALRVFSQYNGQPVYLVNCTFGGADGYGNSGANGGAISSIGVSWTIINTLFSYNQAIGYGGNPAQSGTPGGGCGGAIYNDGNEMTLAILGSKIVNNHSNTFGAGVFFVTNNHTGDIVIKNSTITGNTGGGWHTLPGISMHADTKQTIVNSTITN